MLSSSIKLKLTSVGVMEPEYSAIADTDSLGTVRNCTIHGIPTTKYIFLDDSRNVSLAL